MLLESIPHLWSHFFFFFPYCLSKESWILNIVSSPDKFETGPLESFSIKKVRGIARVQGSQTPVT